MPLVRRKNTALLLRRVGWVTLLGVFLGFFFWVMVNETIVGNWNARKQAKSRQNALYQDAVYSRLRSKLWLAYVYQIHGENGEAQRVYKDMIGEGWEAEEVQVAQRLLNDLESVRQETQKREPAVQAAAPVPGKPARLRRAKSSASPAPAAKPVPSAAIDDIPAIGVLESALPKVIHLSTERLSRQMRFVGVERLTRAYTDKELKLMVLEVVESQLPGRLTETSAEIHSDGILGRATVLLGKDFPLPVVSRIGIRLMNEKPHVEIHEILIKGMKLPEEMRRLIERRVNSIVDRSEYPLKFKSFQLREGSALISVEQA